MFFFLHFSPISNEQRMMKDALIILTVKDRDYFGISNQFVSECFISFEEIENGDPMEQRHLNLSRPNTTGSLHY